MKMEYGFVVGGRRWVEKEGVGALAGREVERAGPL